jgi:protein PhnA
MDSYRIRHAPLKRPGIGRPPEGDMTEALERAEGACELCSATDDVQAIPVPPRNDAIAVCSACRAQLEGAPLEPSHWYCLQGSAWSDVPAVQVTAWRLLGRLDEPWAADLRDQLYLDDDAMAWATDVAEARAPVLDSNGTPLADGDTVTLIKDLDVKGANFTAKRGTVVKSIRLGDDPGLVEGRVNKTAIYLKTEFLKKA